ncbi:hypothetical protein D3C72_1511520 [compost metagenome]
MVAIGRGALQKAVAGVIAAPVVLALDLVTHPVRARPIGVRIPVDLRPVDAQRHRKPVGNGLCPLDAGRAANLSREAVHIVHEQRTCGLLPAQGNHLLHATHEDHGHGHGQCHEHQHQADAQRIPDGIARTSVPWAGGIVPEL